MTLLTKFWDRAPSFVNRTVNFALKTEERFEYESLNKNSHSISLSDPSFYVHGSLFENKFIVEIGSRKTTVGYRSQCEWYVDTIKLKVVLNKETQKIISLKSYTAFPINEKNLRKLVLWMEKRITTHLKELEEEKIKIHKNLRLSSTSLSEGKYRILNKDGYVYPKVHCNRIITKKDIFLKVISDVGVMKVVVYQTEEILEMNFPYVLVSFESSSEVVLQLKYFLLEEEFTTDFCYNEELLKEYLENISIFLKDLFKNEEVKAMYPFSLIEKRKNLL